MGWSWENIWSVWSVCSLLVFPFLAAFYTVPGLAVGYHEVAAPVIARVVFYGFAWGIAQVLFGLSVERIGIALTFSIDGCDRIGTYRSRDYERLGGSPVLGSSAAIGTLLPFIRLHSELLITGCHEFEHSTVGTRSSAILCTTLP
jgi:L-rhamnose-H+ transport protein